MRTSQYLFLGLIHRRKPFGPWYALRSLFCGMVIACVSMAAGWTADFKPAGRWEGAGKGIFGMRYEMRLDLAEDGSATLVYADEEPPHTLNSDFQRNLIRATGQWSFADDTVHLDISVREWKRQLGNDEPVDVEPTDVGLSLDTAFSKPKPPRGRGIKDSELFLQKDGTLLQAMMTFTGSWPIGAGAIPFARMASGVKLKRIDQLKQPDPVGEWIFEDAGRELSLCFWESGEGAGEFSTPDGDVIQLDGEWEVITDGRWKDHVLWRGRVVYWAKSGNPVTPSDGQFEFVLSVEPSKLSLIRGGNLKAADGTELPIHGPNGNASPVFRRQNDQRPTHRTPGNA